MKCVRTCRFIKPLLIFLLFLISVIFYFLLCLLVLDYKFLPACFMQAFIPAYEKRKYFSRDAQSICMYFTEATLHKCLIMN